MAGTDRDYPRINLTGGVVFTRDELDLGPGELVRGVGVRLKPGDNTQVHRDFGRTQTHAFESPTAELGPLDFIQFEQAPNFLLVWVKFSGAYAPYLAHINGGDLILIPAVDGVPIGTEPTVFSNRAQYFLGFGKSATSTPGFLLYEKDGTWAAKRLGMKTLAKSAVGATPTLVPELHKHWWSNYWTAGLTDETVTGVLQADIWKHFVITRDPPLGGPVSAANETRVWVYWVCEYDSEFDLESPPYYMGALSAGDTAAAVFSNELYRVAHGDAIKLSWGVGSPGSYTPTGFDPAVRRNLRADKYRLYRAFLGSWNPSSLYTPAETAKFQAAGQKYFDYRRGKHSLVGYLIDEQPMYDSSGVFTGTLCDRYVTPSDPGTSRPYPLVEVLGTSYDGNRPIEPFSVGGTFQGRVYANVPGLASNVLFVSEEGNPECQPGGNFIAFATNRKNALLGSCEVNSRLMLLFDGGVTAIQRWPFGENTGDATAAAEKVDEDHGLVGNRAYAVIQLPQGSAVVWLSHAELRMSTGSGAINACADFSVVDAGLEPSLLSEAVLINDTANARLLLYCARAGETGNLSRYDFYFHQSHLKPGGFKVYGPHPCDFAVKGATTGIVNGVSRVWTSAANAIWRENVLLSQTKIDLRSGWLYNARLPITKIISYKAILGHSALPGGVLPSVEVRAASTNGAERTRTARPQTGEFKQLSIMQLENEGERISAGVTFDSASSPDAVSLGPLKLETNEILAGR